MKEARAGAAGVIASLVAAATGLDLPVRLRAWDCSEAGAADGPVLVVRSPRALRRLLWSPGELGLARAYITGDLDVEGDIAEGLNRVRAAIDSAPPAAVLKGKIDQRKVARAAVAAAFRLGVIGLPPRPPSCELRISGRMHSRSRDKAVVAGHYDLTAAFYELILDPNMAYSCAWWPTEEGGKEGEGSGDPLADAQRAKLDMICDKLQLEPGSRLLDMGCGWGSLTVHAARERQARVSAVTLSGEQGRFTTKRVADAGLADLATVTVQDYRDTTDGGEPYDAIASVEMGEHVGAENYPRFCAALHDLLRPGGRLLVQQMSRGDTAPGGGPFIESYITPDMHMRPVAETVELIERAGFEVIGVDAMREHYVRTIHAWTENFERNLPRIEQLLGPERVRVWRLYLVGSALAFAADRMGVDQILAIRKG